MTKGVYMKKRTIVLSVLIIGLLVGQIQIVKGLQKTYEWDIPADTGYNTYQVSLITSDSWQVDTTVKITFRLTMTSKRPVLDHTETNSVKIVLSSENFIMDSGSQTETVILTNIGDYWEKEISFYIPAEKVNRGQALIVSITFVVDMDEIDNIQWKSWNHVGNNYDNPMYVSLYRPILSTLELILVAIVIIIVVAGIVGFVLYRRRKVSVKTPSPTLQ